MKRGLILCALWAAIPLSACADGSPSSRRTWQDQHTGCVYFKGEGHASSVVSIRYRMDGTPDCPDAGKGSGK